MKTFFLWLGRMGYQKSVFSYWFQKSTYDLSKKCTQKMFCQKNFFWMHFLQRSYVHLWNQYEKTDFLMPHSTYSKKKSFHLFEGTMHFFENWKGQKWKKQLKISKNGFLLTDLRFSSPFQNFMSHIEIMKFCQNHWSLMPTHSVMLCAALMWVLAIVHFPLLLISDADILCCNAAVLYCSTGDVQLWCCVVIRYSLCTVFCADLCCCIAVKL